MRSRKFRQFENFVWRLLRSVDWKSFQTAQKVVNLIEGDSLPAMGHQEAVANFIKPQDGNRGTLLREAGKNIQAVFAVCFIFQEPLEREGGVQHKITHRRWPS